MILNTGLLTCDMNEFDEPCWVLSTHI